MNNPFDGGMPFNPDDFKSLPPKDALKAMAPLILPKLQMLDNPLVRGILEAQVQDQLAELRDLIGTTELRDQIDALSYKLQSLTYYDVRNVVETSITQSIESMDAKDPATYPSPKELYSDLQTYLSIQKEVYSFFPDELKAVYDAALAANNTTFDAYMTKMFSLDGAQTFETTKSVYSLVPVDTLTVAIFEMLQKATPDNIETALKSLAGRLDETDVTGVAFDGIAVMTDLLRTAVDEDRMGLSDPDTARDFGAGVKKVFNAVAESLKDAGITPEVELRKAAIEAFTPMVEKVMTLPAAGQVIKTKPPASGDFKF